MHADTARLCKSKAIAKNNSSGKASELHAPVVDVSKPTKKETRKRKNRREQEKFTEQEMRTIECEMSISSDDDCPQPKKHLDAKEEKKIVKEELKVEKEDKKELEEGEIDEL